MTDSERSLVLQMKDNSRPITDIHGIIIPAPVWAVESYTVHCHNSVELRIGMYNSRQDWVNDKEPITYKTFVFYKDGLPTLIDEQTQEVTQLGHSPAPDVIDSLNLRWDGVFNLSQAHRDWILMQNDQTGVPFSEHWEFEE